MAADLMLDFENMVNQTDSTISHTESILINEDDKMGFSLFDDLLSMGGADDVLRALENSAYAAGSLEQDFDFDLTLWDCDSPADVSYTDAETAVGSCCSRISPSSSPSPAGSLSPCIPHSLRCDLLQDESLSLHSQMSPVSICTEAGSCSAVRPTETSQRWTSKAARAPKAMVPLAPKVSLVPRSVISTVPVSCPFTPLQPKTLVDQPLQPLQSVQNLDVQPAPLAGPPVLLCQAAQMVQVCPAVVPAVGVLPVTDLAATVPMTVPSHQPSMGAGVLWTGAGVMRVTLGDAGAARDTDVMRRQQRMIRNRESASISRKKKKDYLMTLEARLKVALLENEKLKNDNCSLKKQLEGLATENNVLKARAPRARNLCLFVVLVFLVLNIGPIGLRDSDPSPMLSDGTAHSTRHLLSFSTPEIPGNVDARSSANSIPEERALMVVERVPTSPCHSAVNRTKSIKINRDLHLWVQRLEVDRSKSLQTDGSLLRANVPEKSLDKDSDIVTVKSTAMSEKSPASELQLYYVPHGSYSNLLEEIHRRGDTFYVVSFHRDHLLLPATQPSKGSRPKLSVVLPAVSRNNTVIKDNHAYEMMMQIDCEVTDTKILHIKTASIPPFLLVNNTGSYSAKRTGQACY